MTKKPNSMRHLDDAIRRSCGGAAQDYMRLRTCMANAIVAQILPDGVVKGGSAIKMRYGDAATSSTKLSSPFALSTSPSTPKTMPS